MKQTITILYLLFLFLISPINAQNLIKEKRNLAEFKGIEVSKGIEVFFSQADTFEIEIEADEVIIPSVITEINAGILKLGIDDKYNRLKFKKSVVRVHITSPTINSLHANAGSKISGLTKLEVQDLSILVTSNSLIVFDQKISATKLAISANTHGIFLATQKSTAQNASLLANSEAEITVDLDVEQEIVGSATGKGKINSSGKAESGMFSATSHAEIKMKNFEVKNANVVASTWSIIQIKVKDFLAATSANGAVINISGKPKKVNKETTLGGKIR